MNKKQVIFKMVNDFCPTLYYLGRSSPKVPTVLGIEKELNINIQHFKVKVKGNIFT